MPWVSLQDNSVRFYHSTVVILFSHSKPAFCAFVLGNWVFICSICITGILTVLCVTDVTVILKKTDAISEYGFMIIPQMVDPFGCVQFCEYSISSKGMAHYWLRRFPQKY